MKIQGGIHVCYAGDLRRGLVLLTGVLAWDWAGSSALAQWITNVWRDYETTEGLGVLSCAFRQFSYFNVISFKTPKLSLAFVLTLFPCGRPGRNNSNSGTDGRKRKQKKALCLQQCLKIFDCYCSWNKPGISRASFFVGLVSPLARQWIVYVNFLWEQQSTKENNEKYRAATEGEVFQ